MTSKMLVQVLALSAIWLAEPVTAQPANSASAGSSQAEDKFTLFFPGSWPSGAATDIVEFRARSPSLEDRSLFGHGFVALGKRFPDGSAYFYSVSGYYPDTSGSVLQGLKNTLSGPGRVEYKLVDMKNDRVYRTDISPSQARLVKHIIKNFPEKDYALLGNSCGDMMKNVAGAIGLSYGKSDLKPTSIVDSIAGTNPPGRPAEKAARDKLEGEAIVRGLGQERDQTILGGIKIDQSRPVAIPFNVPVQPLPQPGMTMTPLVPTTPK